MRIPPFVLLLVGLLAWASAACSSGDEVGDMALILESGPEVVEITARSARVIAATSIDVVCSVAFGTTEEYGQLATDDDMAGTGHSVHGPLLSGLMPDTEYHFTLGGIGPDGTVYRYRDVTFRTLPEAPGAAAKPSGDNLALLASGARVVGTSSNFGGGGDADAWGGNRAIDGDPATQWSTDGDGDEGWIEIELTVETRVTGLGYWTRTMGTSAQVYVFRVVSDTGETRGPFQLDDASSVHYFETAFNARRLRFEVVESSGGSIGAVEIEVYGEPLR